MTDPAERFIEAAVRPLADNAELQVMAAQELRTVIQSRPEGASGDSFDQAAENLERARPKSRWKIALYATAALAVILAAIPLARDYMRLRLASYALFSMDDSGAAALPGLRFGPDVEQKVPGLFGPLTDSERLLLFGDPSKTNAMRLLWKSDPENPALFADYARSVASKPNFPSDFLQTADRLDPQNAWFRYVAANVEAQGNVTTTQPPLHPRKPSPSTPRYRVFNATAQTEALRLFEEASRLPEMKSYYDELVLRRLKILPPGEDVLGRKLTRAYLYMVVPRGSTNWDLTKAIAARAEELAIAGDREGFVKLMEQWEIFVRRSVESDGRLNLRELPAFTRAAKMLGLDHQAARYARLEAAVEKRREAGRVRDFKLGEQWLGLARAGGGILATGTAVENPPPVSLSDLIPGEMAAQEMWRRIASAVVGVLMLVALLLAASGRFMRGRQARALSEALVNVLRPFDHRLILIGGIVAPIVIHLLVECLLPVTTSSASLDAGLPIFLRFGALGGLLLMLPALIASRQLGLRLGCLGWPRVRVFAIVALISTAVIAMASGCTQSEGAQAMGWSLVIVHITVLIINLTLGILFCPRHQAVRFLTWGRSLVPAYSMALLLMALLVPLHHAREKHWTKLNVLTKIDPDVPAMNRYEYEVEQQVRTDLLELLDAKP